MKCPLWERTDCRFPQRQKVTVERFVQPLETFVTLSRVSNSDCSPDGAHRPDPVVQQLAVREKAREQGATYQ